MKKILTHVKWRRIGWLLTGLLVLTLTIQAIDSRDIQKIASADINIDRTSGLFFMDSADVMETLHTQRIYPGVSLVRSVPCDKLERIFEANPFCDNAEVFIDALGNLHVDVRQRIPVIRIINTNGVGYYLDSAGTKLPLHDKFTARVIAANGFIGASDNNADTTGQNDLNALRSVALALNADTFLNRLVDQIWFDENKEVHLVPKFAKQEVLLGNTNDLDKKLIKLKAFYRNTARTSLSVYKTIDLRYYDEIYATRRDYVPAPRVSTVPDSSHTHRQSINPRSHEQ